MLRFRVNPLRLLSFTLSGILLSSPIVRAQVTEAWVVRHAGTGTADDRATAVTVDDAGFVYVTGQRGGATGLDLVTIKYDPAGVQVWLRTYDGALHLDDVGMAITVDDAGNVYATGWSESTGPLDQKQDYVTIKYDADGNEQWARRYNGPAGAWDEPFAIVVDGAGNVHVTGRSCHTSIWFDFDFLTIKYDADGNELWVARSNGAANDWDEARGLALDDDGNVYVTGHMEREPGTAFMDFATVKYDSNGIEKWRRFFDGAGENSDIADAIAIDELGHVVVTGHSAGVGTNWDYVTVQYDLAGNHLWDRLYNSGISFSADVPSAIDTDAAGNVYVTGSSVLDYGTVKYDVNGNEQWVRRFGTSGVDDKPASLIVGGSGNVYVTGVSANNYLTIKYDPSGTKVWDVTYDGPASGNAEDAAAFVTVDALENVYVTGFSNGVGTAADIASIKYVQPATGVGPIALGSSGRLELAQNRPNPFATSTTIAFALPGAGAAQLRVLDVRGRAVATLWDGPVGAGGQSVEWRAADQPAGVYFVRLEANGESTTRKMVLTR